MALSGASGMYSTKITFPAAVDTFGNKVSRTTIGDPYDNVKKSKSVFENAIDTQMKNKL